MPVARYDDATVAYDSTVIYDVFDAVASGLLADLSFAIQAAKGVVPAATHRVRFAGGTPLAPAKPFGLSRATLTQPVPRSGHVESVRPVGEPVVFARPDALGALLYAVLGAKAVAGAADPYTHTFTPAPTQPWVTFWQSLGGVLHGRFDDCLVSSLRVTSRAGTGIIVAIGVLGITSRYRDVPEESVPVEITTPFLHHDGQGELRVEGTAVAAIDEWELLIDRGVAPRDTLAAYDVRTGPRAAISMRVGQTLVNTALWNRLNYGAAVPANNTPAGVDVVELVAPGLAFKVTAPGSPERSLAIALPRVALASISDLTFDVGGRPLRQAASYVALKGAGAGITATVMNGRSGY